MQKYISKCFAILFFAIALFMINTPNVSAEYKLGDANSDIVTMQQQLIELGYNIPVPDGVYDKDTSRAVQQFQKDSGLKPDGVFGMATYNKLVSKKEWCDTYVSRAPSLSKIKQILKYAYSYMGVPYVWGGTTPNGFDCSGFTQYVFKKAGVFIPRLADAQCYYGKPVSAKDLQVGDLVFFETYTAGPSHCGIYVGDGKFIEAGSSSGVTVDKVFGPYWGSRYVGACRISL